MYKATDGADGGGSVKVNRHQTWLSRVSQRNKPLRAVSEISARAQRYKMKCQLGTLMDLTRAAAAEVMRQESLLHLSSPPAWLHLQITKCGCRLRTDPGRHFQLAWQLKLCCIDKAKPPTQPPTAMSHAFVRRGVGWSTFHNCHQLPIIQLLFCGTNVLLRLLFSQQWEGNKRLLINCVFTPRG